MRKSETDLNRHSDTKHIGSVGEDIAVRFLLEKGFSIKARNYRKKYGEIDIVAEWNGVIHFVEVKVGTSTSVHHIRPEEHVSSKKIERLYRVIQSYLLECCLRESEWQIDVVAIDLFLSTREAKVRHLTTVY